MTAYEQVFVSTGGHFRLYLNDVRPDDVARLFGEPHPKVAYFEPERGYDGLDWCFQSDTGARFHVYARWGMLRLGSNETDEDNEAFARWLREQVQQVLTTIRELFGDASPAALIKTRDYCVREYRRRHPKSRAVDVTTLRNSSATCRRRTCIFCRRVIATSAGAWPETKQSLDAADKHWLDCPIAFEYAPPDDPHQYLTDLVASLPSTQNAERAARFR